MIEMFMRTREERDVLLGLVNLTDEWIWLLHTANRIHLDDKQPYDVRCIAASVVRASVFMLGQDPSRFNSGDQYLSRLLEQAYKAGVKPQEFKEEVLNELTVDFCLRR